MAAPAAIGGMKRPRRGGNRGRRSGGFSLLELLLSMTIVGLTVGLGVSLAAEASRRAKDTQTLDNAERVAQALGAYLAANHRLPCAADPTASPAGGAVTGAACTTMPRGLVPWSTLGLQQRDVRDGYGRFFSYHVDPAFTATTITTIAQFCSTAPSTGTGAAPDKPLRLYASVTGSLAAPVFSAQLLSGQSVAFVLLGSGANGFKAWIANAADGVITQIAGPPASLLSESINAVTTTSSPEFATYIDRDWTIVEPDTFDDFPFYKSVPAFTAIYAGTMC